MANQMKLNLCLGLFVCLFLYGSPPAQAQSDSDAPGGEAGYDDEIDPIVPEQQEPADDQGADEEDEESSESDDEEDDEATDQETEYGGEFVPTWDDEDDDTEYGDKFVPTWDDEESDTEYGDELVPSWQDEEESGDGETEYGDEVEPSWEDEPEWTDGEDWDGDEEEYYQQFWEELDDQEEEETAPPEEIVEGTGRIAGVVIDDEFDEPMSDATITIDGTDLSLRTGVTGQFFFDVPAGTYVLRISSLGYQAQAYQLEVIEGQTTDMGEVPMEVDQATVATIVVEGRANEEGQATQVLRRRESAAVSDAISPEEMSRTPDSSAKDAARRVVSATIQDGQFLFVRGLGGRYSRVLLNGVGVPSTDPDFPGVQLDLFPASLLAGLTVYKTFTPDMPADFAGGVMNIATRDYPEDFRLQLGLSLSGDTDTTFQDQLRYAGGSFDPLGFDDGTRALPDAAPTDTRMEAGRGFTSGEVEEIAETFPNTWAYHRSTALPNLSLSGTIGDTVAAGERDFGYLATFSFSNSRSTDQAEIRDVRLEGEGDSEEITIRQELDQGTGTERVHWGALATVSYEIADHQNLSLLSMWNHSADDRMRLVTGYSEQEGTDIEARQLQWIERTLWFNQLLGSHRQLFRDSEIEWYLSAAVAQRDEPDTRNLTYMEGPTGFQWRAAPGSGERFYSELDQLDLGGGLGFRLPIVEELELAVGGDVLFSERDFAARRFRMEYIGDSAAGRLLPPETLFSAQNIGELTEMVEITNATDGYGAEQQLYAGYASLDWQPSESVRLAAGTRFEQFHQLVEPSSPFAMSSADPDDRADRTDTDFLPSFSAVFTLMDDMYLRLGYGGTVARPQVRELAPFLFQDYIRRRSVEGNPDLERTFVHNADIRWEWYLGPVDLVAVSVFFKEFLDPIEQVILDRNANISYFNVDSARNFGVELEARLSLDLLHPSLEPWLVGMNLALIDSQVTLTEEQLLNATSSERPLAGQAPYVANVSLGYAPPDIPLQIFAFYNVTGARIEDVGRLGLPDLYREPFHALDLTVRWGFAEDWNLKLAARNLLFQSVRETQGDVTTLDAEQGLSLSLKLGWSY